MGKRQIKRLDHVVILFDRDWDEYVVSFRGDRNDRRSYYTSDRQDAIDTADAMEREAARGAA